MSQRRAIKPIPNGALDLSGITPTVSTQNDESALLVSAVSEPPRRRTEYRTPPKLAAKVLADTQPSELISLEKSQREIDALAKVVADADARREAGEAEELAAERSKITDWRLNKMVAEMNTQANATASTSNGGNKKKDTYTVKELKTIASRNNIKTTKKLNGKTVPLNKKGLVAKLKRNKVI
jgi:hypothetical protein